MSQTKKGLSVITLLCTLIVPTVNADSVYNYTGNPFNHSEAPPGTIGDWLIASVTFSNPAITNSFSGDVYASSISKWSISLAQQPTIQLDYTNAISDARFPLWFHFDNGEITSWQLEARQSYPPEIYTTHNSPYYQIAPTADYYIPGPDLVNWGNNMYKPGVWVEASVPIPASIWLVSSGLVGLVGFARRKV